MDASQDTASIKSYLDKVLPALPQPGRIQVTLGDAVLSVHSHRVYKAWAVPCVLRAQCMEPEPDSTPATGLWALRLYRRTGYARCSSTTVYDYRLYLSTTVTNTCGTCTRACCIISDPDVCPPHLQQHSTRVTLTHETAAIPGFLACIHQASLLLQHHRTIV